MPSDKQDSRPTAKSVQTISIQILPSNIGALSHLISEYKQYNIFDDNVFLSDAWLELWFIHIGAHHSPSLIRFVENEKTVGFVLTAQSYIPRRKFFKRRILYLNEYPVGDKNLVLEFNGIVCMLEYKAVLWEKLAQWFVDSQDQVDEFSLNLLLEEDAFPAKKAFDKQGLFVHLSQPHPCPYALLNEPDKAWGVLEKENISASKRRQIRKSGSLYEETFGEVKIHIAQTVKEAKLFFNALEQLHTDYWNNRGHEGAFTNKTWVKFQHDLIEGSQNKYTQVIKVTAGEHVIGYLYNLICGTKIYNIQSGLSYHSDNRIRPGFTCHYLAMKENAELGMTEYHYLAGGENYKVSLSAKQKTLYWLTVKRKSFYLIEDSLVFIVRLLKRLRRGK